MWEPDHFRLFITHVATRKIEAHELKRHLEPFYVSCFVAHDDIEPTREWEDEIEEALRTMDALAALLSPDGLIKLPMARLQSEKIFVIFFEHSHIPR